MMARTYRPCGECSAYVLAETGCKHWKPGGTVRSARQARYDRQKEVDAAAKQRAAQAVADFRRQMDLGVRG
jgi:hypothetical protein